MMLHRTGIQVVLAALVSLHGGNAFNQTLVIRENAGYSVSEKLYTSPAEYQCVGWNIFYSDMAKNDRYFFFVKFFYAHCLSPYRVSNYMPSASACDIDCIAERFAKRRALKTDLTVDATVPGFDTLVVINETGTWVYDGAPVLEMFALEKNTARKTLYKSGNFEYQHGADFTATGFFNRHDQTLFLGGVQ